MLTKAVVFLFCVIGMFGLLVNTMPNAFTLHQIDTSGAGQNVQVAEYFDVHNLTKYQHQYGPIYTTGVGWDNKTIPSGMGAGDWIELYWLSEAFIGSGFEVRHAHDQWYGRSGHNMFFYHNGVEILHTGGPYMQPIGIAIKNDLVNYYDSTLQGTYFDLQCGDLVSNIVFSSTYPGVSIGNAYDNGTLTIIMSYEVNMNGTSLSMWSIISSLFTFSAPSLGVPGLGGSIITSGVSTFMWALVAVVAYKVLTGVIPWLSGGSGD